MKTKRQELEDSFEWWITSIPDKINRLHELIPSEITNELNYSIESLVVLGNYMCQVIITIDNLKDNAILWDCAASYVGTTYRRNVISAEWYMELDNHKDLYYGVPMLRTTANTRFYPKYEISTMLDRKRPDFLKLVTNQHQKLQTHM